MHRKPMFAVSERENRQMIDRVNEFLLINWAQHRTTAQAIRHDHLAGPSLNTAGAKHRPNVKSLIGSAKGTDYAECGVMRYRDCVHGYRHKWRKRQTVCFGRT